VRIKRARSPPVAQQARPFVADLGLAPILGIRAL
jgi:hypothetical protein